MKKSFEHENNDDSCLIWSKHWGFDRFRHFCISNERYLTQTIERVFHSLTSVCMKESLCITSRKRNVLLF